MMKVLLFCVFSVYRLNVANGDTVVSSSTVTQDTTKDVGDANAGKKNASYFVNPKQFLTYAEQFDKIRSLGAEVRCKLRGSCVEKTKRHKIAKKVRKSKAAKKTLSSVQRGELPDNHNNVLSPESMMSPVSSSLLPPGMGSDYTQQPGAAAFGQQPQMNVKLPRGMEVPMGAPGSPSSLDQIQNAENEASIQNSIRAKMDFMDRANGPQMQIPGMHGMQDMAPGGAPEGLPGDMMSPPQGARAFRNQHKSNKEKAGVSIRRSTSNAHAEGGERNPSAQVNATTFHKGSEGNSSTQVNSITHANSKEDDSPSKANVTTFHKGGEGDSHALVNGTTRAKLSDDDSPTQANGTAHVKSSQGNSPTQVNGTTHAKSRDDNSPTQVNGTTHAKLSPGNSLTPFNGVAHVKLSEGNSPTQVNRNTPAKFSQGNSPTQVNGTVHGKLNEDISPMQVNQTARARSSESNSPSQVNATAHHKETEGNSPTQMNAPVKGNSSVQASQATVNASEGNSPATRSQGSQGDSPKMANEPSLPTLSNKTENASRTSTTKDASQNITKTGNNASLNNNVENDSMLNGKNGSASLNDAKNKSTLVATGNGVQVSKTSRTYSPVPVSKTLIPKDIKATKKSFGQRRTMDLTSKPNDLPPIYLTVRNGEKVLVVHPTAEFLQSLPRINFTESNDDRRSVGSSKLTDKYTGIYAKRDDLLLAKKNGNDDDTDDVYDGNNDAEDGSESSTDPSVDRRSNIAYVSIPVVSAEPESPLRHWLARNNIARRDLRKNFDSFKDSRNQLGNIYTTDEYLKGERKSSTALAVPSDIENLYKKFHPDDSKTNFQYVPTRDEVAEELQYAQRTSNFNAGVDGGSVEQNTQNRHGDLQQTSPGGDYDTTGGETSDTAAASPPDQESLWEERYKSLDSDGRKRSENPLYSANY